MLPRLALSYVVKDNFELIFLPPLLNSRDSSSVHYQVQFTVDFCFSLMALELSQGILPAPPPSDYSCHLERDYIHFLFLLCVSALKVQLQPSDKWRIERACYFS